MGWPDVAHEILVFGRNHPEADFFIALFLLALASRVFPLWRYTKVKKDTDD